MNPLLARLSGLSAAEEFFDALAVPFDQRVLDVHRLHVLKRFNALLDAATLESMEPAAATERARTALARAYAEFAEGNGDKTFKVFRDCAPGGAFVPLAALRGPG